VNAMPPFQPTDPVPVTLQAQEWNTVIGALMDAPYRIAAPLIGKIVAQAQRHDAPIEEKLTQGDPGE
jgi:hypothetical protein